MLFGHIQNFLSPLLPLSLLDFVADRQKGKEDPTMMDRKFLMLTSYSMEKHYLWAGGTAQWVKCLPRMGGMYL